MRLPIIRTRRASAGFSPRPSAGFSLVELSISIALLALVLASVSLLGSTTSAAVSSGALASDVEIVLGRALGRVSRELVVTGTNVLLPDPLAPIGSETIDYQKPVGVSSGAAIWGNRARIALEYESGEANDGLDNTGNRLADECVLTWTLDVGLPTEQRVVLCHSVREYLEGETPNNVDDNGNGLIDERGFCVVREGEALILRLTIERVDVKGRRVTQTLETSVKPRNSPQGGAP
jgi:prepilin-type N-terminal cleavage/methylation domain-containing protein